MPNTPLAAQLLAEASHSSPSPKQTQHPNLAQPQSVMRMQAGHLSRTPATKRPSRLSHPIAPGSLHAAAYTPSCVTPMGLSGRGTEGKVSHLFMECFDLVLTCLIPKTNTPFTIMFTCYAPTNTISLAFTKVGMQANALSFLLYWLELQGSCKIATIHEA